MNLPWHYYPDLPPALNHFTGVGKSCWMKHPEKPKKQDLWEVLPSEDSLLLQENRTRAQSLWRCPPSCGNGRCRSRTNTRNASASETASVWGETERVQKTRGTRRPQKSWSCDRKDIWWLGHRPPASRSQTVRLMVNQAIPANKRRSSSDVRVDAQ